MLGHQWTLWKVWGWSACSEIAWIIPTKSTCICLKWNSNPCLEVLQFKKADLYHSYEMYGWCLNDQNTTSSSKISVLKFKAVFASFEIWKAILVFSDSCVDFKFQTSYILILRHVRHQFSHGFSQVLKNARILSLNYVTWNLRKKRESLFWHSFGVVSNGKHDLYL